MAAAAAVEPVAAVGPPAAGVSCAAASTGAGKSCLASGEINVADSADAGTGGFACGFSSDAFIPNQEPFVSDVAKTCDATVEASCDWTTPFEKADRQRTAFKRRWQEARAELLRAGREVAVLQQRLAASRISPPTSLPPSRGTSPAPAVSSQVWVSGGSDDTPQINTSRASHNADADAGAGSGIAALCGTGESAHTLLGSCSTLPPQSSSRSSARPGYLDENPGSTLCVDRSSLSTSTRA